MPAAQSFHPRKRLGLRYDLVAAGFCAFAPYLVRSQILTNEFSLKIVVITGLASFAAILCGVFFIRNMNNYPGVESSASIFPAFTLSFAIVFFVFFFFRIDYARFMLLSAYLLSITIFYALYFLIQRKGRIVFGVVPGGHVQSLMEIGHVEWVALSDTAVLPRQMDAIAVDLRHDHSDDWERRLADFALAGMPVYHSKHLYESLTGRVQLEQLSENSFGTLTPVSAYMRIKHLLDWLTASVALVVLLPLLIIVGLLIMIDSPGGPIFRQRRIGYAGMPFTVWKFRTMRTNRDVAPDARHAAMTDSQDARITRFGRFLRTTRIDELPQIINILRREMSWIGPRPEAEVLSNWYTAELPFYRYRHIVRPGLTGWAQVNQGHVAEVEDVREKLYYDFYYIKNFSLWIDLLIIARTIKTVLTGFGAR